MIVGNRFNIYLAALVAAALALGCQSPEKKRQKQASLLRIHLEAASDVDTNRSLTIQISRDTPVDLKINSGAFLTEADIKEAKVVEEGGGFAIRLQFDRKGSWLLEEYSAGNRNKHFAIFSQFVNPADAEHTVGRWLAAPKITQRITDGVLQFSPDASREEADQIVLGLNNVAKKLEKDSIWSN